MKKVLVAGATGYLGRYVLQELKKQGYRVRALARNANKLENLKEYIDEVFEGEVTNPETLIGICESIDYVISSVGITKQKDGLTYMDVDYQGNKNLLEEAKKEGISKFIYVSVFNAEKMKNLKGIQAKVRFTEELKESGLNYLIVYPNGFFSDMLDYLQMAKKGKVHLFGDGEYKMNPIDGGDLAKVIVDNLEKDVTEIDVGGPEVLTHNQIAKLAFKIVDKPEKISYIPLWVKNVTLWFLRKFISVKTYGPIEFFMTVLTKDMVAPKYGKKTLKEFFRESK